MKRNIVRIPMQTASARVMAETINVEKRTVVLVLATETPARMVKWEGWDYEEITEILSLEDAHVRLERLRKTGQLLRVHRARDLSDIMGSIDEVWIENRELMVEVRFSEREDVEPFFKDVVQKIIKNVSVGYRVHRYVDETPDGDKIRTLRAIDWEPHEGSLVPIPADINAGIRSIDGLAERAEDQDTNECEIVSQNETEETTEIEETTETQGTGEESEMSKKQGELEQPVDLEAVRKAAREEERKSQQEIRTAVRLANLPEAFAEELISANHTPDQARAAVFKKLEESQKNSSVRNHVPSIEITRDEVETRREGMTEALLHRHDPVKNQLTDKSRAFRGMSLIRLAEEILGRSARGLSKSELAVRALASADFPIITGGVAMHVLRNTYQGGGRTFLPFVNEGTLPDFKEMSRIALGDFPNLEDVPEGADYTFGTVGEGAEKIKLGKKGKKLRLTEEAIINDDTSAFTRLPAMAGAAGLRAERKAVYGILMGSHKMSDGTELFHADHKNLAASGANITTGLDAAVEALRSQKSLDGLETLNLEMATMIVGPKKEAEAKRILSADMLATKSADVNIYKGKFDLVVDAEITDSRWIITGNKSLIDLIELAYLEGMAGPQISTSFDEANDTIIYKVKHIFGVKAIDYRGFYKNPGA